MRTAIVKAPAASPAGHLQQLIVGEGGRPIIPAPEHGGQYSAARWHVDACRQGLSGKHKLEQACSTGSCSCEDLMGGCWSRQLRDDRVNAVKSIAVTCIKAFAELSSSNPDKGAVSSRESLQAWV